MGDPLTELGVATGAAAASGLRLYATVAALGLLDRYGVLHLPGSLAVLANPVIIGVAATLYAAEFIADKIPAFDSVWDAVHTFIRIPAGAVLAFALLGDVQEPWRTAAALLGGAVALSAHGLKASARLAANASPEPFTNWGLSFSEEGLVVALLWLVVAHPFLALAAGLACVVLAVVVASRIVGAARRLFGRPSAA
ncbi:MAG TPA: DUF4126 domain-containing protein [Dehalococcoidia bacterium]